MIKVNKDWWKTLFDRIYLITDQRSVCDRSLTSREVDFLERILSPEKSDRILDLCGGNGRHSLELVRRGYRELTVLDYSQFLIDLGSDTAQKEGLEVVFYQGDARKTGLRSNGYNLIIVMANSFGYFIDEKENISILHEVHRLLKGGGRVLMDIPNREYVIDNFRPISWHEADDDLVVLRERELVDGTVRSREMVLSKKRGLIREANYCERLYGPGEMTNILTKAGFNETRIIKDFSLYEKEGDYGFMENRMIVTARKHKELKAQG